MTKIVIKTPEERQFVDKYAEMFINRCLYDESTIGELNKLEDKSKITDVLIEASYTFAQTLYKSREKLVEFDFNADLEGD